MYDVWYNVLTQKNWPCTSNKMQDPLSEQLSKRNATIATRACDYPPCHESLDTRNTDRLDSISALCKLYAMKICLLKDGTMIDYTPSSNCMQASLLSTRSQTLSHLLSNFDITAFQATQRKAVM